MVDEYKHDLVLIDLKNALMYLQTLADATLNWDEVYLLKRLTNLQMKCPLDGI